MDKEPIFFAWTRSFWLGIFPALLTALDIAFQIFGDPATSAPVAAALAWVVGLVGGTVTPDAIARVMQAMAPLYALIVAQQRSHAARPYTIDPRALK